LTHPGEGNKLGDQINLMLF